MKLSERTILLIRGMIVGLVFVILAGSLASYPQLHQRWLDACLWRAAGRNDAGNVSELVRQGANINGRDKDGNPLLCETLAWGCIETSRILLRRKPDVNATNPRAGITALMLASGAGADDVVAELINQGAGVNAQSYSRSTALMIAASEKHQTIVANLLKHGADRNLRDIHGNTALLKVQKLLNDTSDAKRKAEYETIIKLLQQPDAA